MKQLEGCKCAASTLIQWNMALYIIQTSPLRAFIFIQLKALEEKNYESHTRVCHNSKIVTLVPSSSFEIYSPYNIPTISLIQLHHSRTMAIISDSYRK